MENEKDGAPSSRWLVYRVDGAPLGPVATEDVADAILRGEIAPDTWVSAPTSSKWLPASAVPVIASILEGTPTRRAVDTEVLPPFSIEDVPSTERLP